MNVIQYSEVGERFDQLRKIGNQAEREQALDALLAEDPDLFLAALSERRMSVEMQISFLNEQYQALNDIARDERTPEQDAERRALFSRREKAKRFHKWVGLWMHRATRYKTEHRSESRKVEFREIRAAIRQHAEDLIAAGASPEEYDLALWATIGLTWDEGSKSLESKAA